MYVIKIGRKLNRAWSLYVCERCGEKSIECKREAKSLFTRVTLADYCFEPEVKSSSTESGIRKCSNCGNEMRPSYLDAERYIETFKNLQVGLDLGGTYFLTEKDLFY